LIERYKVFDLWPCGKEELKSYGFEEATAKISNSRTAQESQELRIASLGKTKKRATIATPDISQMTPFKVSISISNYKKNLLKTKRFYWLNELPKQTSFSAKLPL
jgi:tRNA A-37 threonylcarbamoyl transferase component Bud32